MTEPEATPSRVWIVHRDVDCEGGDVWSVHASEEGAIEAAQKGMQGWDEPNWSRAYDEQDEDGGGRWLCRLFVELSVLPYEVRS